MKNNFQLATHRLTYTRCLDAKMWFNRQTKDLIQSSNWLMRKVKRKTYPLLLDHQLKNRPMIQKCLENNVLLSFVYIEIFFLTLRNLIFIQKRPPVWMRRPSTGCFCARGYTNKRDCLSNAQSDCIIFLKNSGQEK